MTEPTLEPTLSTEPEKPSRLSEKSSPWLLGALGVAILLGGYGIYHLLKERTARLQAELHALTQAQNQSLQAVHHFETLADLKTQDVNQFKGGMSDQALSKKALFEAGLSSQEEKRLLEKQLEIMTTYMTVNIGLNRIFLMRGDQPLESYLFNYLPLKAFGGIPVNLPKIVRIVSKERFAHPERGTSEMVNGKLVWEPPQVGTSVRSNALGEYVLFTNSRLILHGPPQNDTDHEAFPHLCLGLSFEAARNLYQHSFIGTKILLNEDALRPQAVTSIPLRPNTTTSHGN